MITKEVRFADNEYAEAVELCNQLGIQFESLVKTAVRRDIKRRKAELANPKPVKVKVKKVKTPTIRKPKPKPSPEVVERFSKFTATERYNILSTRLIELYGAIPEEDKKVGYVYVLQLANGMKYVGWTTNPIKRMMQHFSVSGGSYITKAYPANTILSIAVGTTRDESELTLQLMKEHGLANVRGGCYAQREIPTNMINNLNKQGIY